MQNKEKRKYGCEDCRWNFLCGDGRIDNCDTFTLDLIMSDTYTEEIIEQRRRESYELWNEYMDEWEDE